MTTCQECNSEISEIETFCPYCGIKIDRPEPVAEPVPVVDESFESTIVISPSDAAIMRDNLAAENESTPEPIAPTGFDDIPAPAILTSEFPGSATDPSIAVGSDRATFESKAGDDTPLSPFTAPPPPPSPFSDAGTDLGSFSIPTVAVEEPAVESEIIEPEIAVEESVNEVEQSAELPYIEPPTEISEPIEDVAPEPVYSQEQESEAVVESYPDPIHVSEPAPATGPEVELADETSPEPIAEPEPEPEPELPIYQASEPDVEEIEEVSEPEIPVYSEHADEEEEVVEEVVQDPAPFVPVVDDEPVASIEEPIEESSESIVEESIPVVAESSSFISKPVDDLEEPEPVPSVFDSVRIMEGLETSGPPQPPANIQPIVTESPAPTTGEPAITDQGTANSLGAHDTDGRKAAKLKPLPEGAVLNKRYEVVRKIGGGGMGAVYLASDNNLGGVLRAVKEMVQSHIEEDQQEKAINDFKRESTILSTLDHPSIPTIYDYFYDADEGRFYLVMKYISGGDLASKLRSSPDGKIDELTATEWALQITDVLNYLHNQPTTIVYRDLKPSNIMLDGNTGRAMLIDFGIARSITQKEEKGVTAVGTMGYAPPELFSGNVEPRSDIYSLGSTLFHLLTGADPQSNPLLIFDFQKNPRPRQINSRLSDQMERILMRTVEYNADQRFASAAELKAVLEEHLGNLRSGNLSYGVTEAPVSVSLENQSVFCGFCGQRIVATDLFCAFCGSKQPLAQQGVHSEIYRHSSVTARLVIEGTSELSAPVFSLQKDESLIGRRDPMSNIFPEVDLSKYDPQTKISRRHAKIWRDGTAFMLEDLGSSNGTLVDGVSANMSRLPAHQPYKLTSGDRIKIGDTSLHFVVG